MISWDAVLIGLNTVAATIVLWSSVCAANHMTRKTPLAIRAAFILVGVGAAAALLSPGYLNRVPTSAEMLLITGMAALTIVDRRRRIARRFARQHAGPRLRP